MLGAEGADTKSATPPLSKRAPPEPLFATIATASPCHDSALPDDLRYPESSLPCPARCSSPDGKDILDFHFRAYYSNAHTYLPFVWCLHPTSPRRINKRPV